MKKYLRDVIRLLRPRQWIKNFALYAALLFSGQLFNPVLFIITTYGVLIFCALSSAIYIINDMFDVEKDRIHPFKKFRPNANNDVSVNLAIAIAVVLALGALIFSYLIDPAFFV